MHSPWKRRTFLQAIGSAGAVSHFAQRSPAAAAQKEIRIAVLGVGFGLA